MLRPGVTNAGAMPRRRKIRRGRRGHPVIDVNTSTDEAEDSDDSNRSGPAAAAEPSDTEESGLEDFIVPDDADTAAGLMIDKIFVATFFDEEHGVQETCYLKVLDVHCEKPKPRGKGKGKAKRRKKSATEATVEWLYTTKQASRIGADIAPGGGPGAKVPYTREALFESNHVQRLDLPGPDEPQWKPAPASTYNVGLDPMFHGQSSGSKPYLAGRIKVPNTPKESPEVTFFVSKLKDRVETMLTNLLTRGSDGVSTKRWRELLPMWWSVKYGTPKGGSPGICKGCNSRHELNTTVRIYDPPCGASAAEYYIGSFCARRILLAHKLYRSYYSEAVPHKARVQMLTSEFYALLGDPK